MEFERLWAAEQARIADLPPSSWMALSQPPLTCLPAAIAAERLRRIQAVPFRDLFSALAVLSLCRPDDTLAALELLGVIEGDEALEEEPAAIAAVQIPQLPAPPKPAPPPGPPAPEPLTLPAAAAKPVSAVSELTAVTSAAPLPDPPSRPCEQCGALFSSSRLRQRFCSRTCQGKDHNQRRLAARAAARPIKACRECGISFQPRKRAAQIFCSEVCQRAAVYTQRGEIPPWQRPPRECVICSKPFMPKKAQQKTCSEACSLAWRRQRNNQGHIERERIAELVERFSSPGRWRWLLRQINETGLEKVASFVNLETMQLMHIMRLIHTKQHKARR